MAQIEVPIATERGVSRNAPQVTDIDVLGIRPSPELKWQLVIGDCKTRRKESPVNRVLWVRGLQEAMGASSSIVLLKRGTATQIERDHKLFADRLEVLLIQEDEFGAYDRAVVYPTGSRDYGESIDALDAVRSNIGNKFPPLRRFVNWIMCEAWANIDHAILIRQLLARMREVRGEFDPRREDHVGLILEASAAFGIPFATLVGNVFRGHLKPDQRAALEDAVRVIVWGGREQYDFYNALRRKVITAKGGDLQEELALPKWNEFLELLRTYLEAPHLSFRTPQLLRDLGIAVSKGTPADVLSFVDDKMLLHLALKVTLYLCHAADLPQDAVDQMKSVFMPSIARLTEAPADSTRVSLGQGALPLANREEEPKE